MVVQLVRIPACHDGGRGFESRPLRQHNAPKGAFFLAYIVRPIDAGDSMLQKLNERIQGIVAWVIISLIAVTFAFFGIDYYFQARNNAAIAAKVNGETISQQEFELNYRRVRQVQDPAQMNVQLDNQLKAQVLDDLVVGFV